MKVFTFGYIIKNVEVILIDFHITGGKCQLWKCDFLFLHLYAIIGH